MFRIEMTFRTKNLDWTAWSDHDQTGYPSLKDVLDMIEILRSEGDSEFRYRPVFRPETEDDSVAQRIVFKN